MSRDTMRQAANVLAFIIMLIVNGAANALPLNNQTTAQISDRFPVYFVPAGYVFAIWGVIYLLLLGFTVYQALPAQRQNPGLQRIGYAFAAGSLLNSVWIFLWHYNYFAATLLVMAALLLTLIYIYLRLNIGRERVSRAMAWLVHLPFSVYLGWISVATIANAADVLYFYGFSSGSAGDQLWAVLMIFVATLLALVMAATRRDIAYLAVIIWACAGIAVKQASTPLVATSATIAALIVAGAFFVVLLRRQEVESLQLGS